LRNLLSREEITVMEPSIAALIQIKVADARGCAEDRE